MKAYIKFFKNNLILLILFLVNVSIVEAHEFWIEPSDYFFENKKLEAHLKVGQEFQGMRLMYDPQRFKTFKILSGSKNKKIESSPNSPEKQDLPRQPIMNNRKRIISHKK